MVAVSGKPEDAAEQLLARFAERLDQRGAVGLAEVRSLLLAEAAPFLLAAELALRGGDEGALAWSEARSLLWLLGYRLGSREFSAHVAAALLPAWRDSSNPAVPQERCDELAALLLDGFGRGRRDSTQERLLRQLAAAMPIFVVEEGLLVGAMMGPLDADAARPFLDRVAKEASRTEALAVVVDATGFLGADPAVLAELEALVQKVRLAGGECSVVLTEEALAGAGEALTSARSASLQEALEQHRQRLGQARSIWARWFGRSGRATR